MSRLCEEVSNDYKRILSATLFLGTLAPTDLPGQAVGEIRGTVTDPTGAIIPAAKVAAEQAGTQLTRSTVTSNAGTYSIPALPVGTYALQVDAAGFKNATSEVKLDVSQQREVNFTLACQAQRQKCRWPPPPRC